MMARAAMVDLHVAGRNAGSGAWSVSFARGFGFALAIIEHVRLFAELPSRYGRLVLAHLVEKLDAHPMRGQPDNYRHRVNVFVGSTLYEYRLPTTTSSRFIRFSRIIPRLVAG